VEVGKAMYARDKESRAVPCWLIMDDRYRRRYAHKKALPGRFPKEWIEKGAIIRADTVEGFAHACGIDASGLQATIREFNRNARMGIDPKFGRGESAHNRGLGDPRHTPKPALGLLERPPFYATQIVPCDVGTCGGLLTDEHARVLGSDGEPIPSLYATGNSTATVMGRHHLGAGASIANSMVFRHIAALHATGVVTPSTVDSQADLSVGEGPGSELGGDGVSTEGAVGPAAVVVGSSFSEARLLRVAAAIEALELA
jgi:3-oxosteroid 1-dehydrogenase